MIRKDREKNDLRKRLRDRKLHLIASFASLCFFNQKPFLLYLLDFILNFLPLRALRNEESRHSSEKTFSDRRKFAGFASFLSLLKYKQQAKAAAGFLPGSPQQTIFIFLDLKREAASEKTFPLILSSSFIKFLR